ncbi:hypothetical protein ABT340_12775 [Streptosporangium sp. NPDC000239]|uniref:hypothetical protein n=1 Tax=Streptosporangium sp. NPDC000239 TaxID=3154248 RepID=UPI00331B807E
MTTWIPRQVSEFSDRTCDSVQAVHPGWLVFHSSTTGLWSAYRSVLFGRPYAGDVLLVRAGSAEELDRKLSAQTAPVVPPSIQAVAVARAIQTARVRKPARVSWVVQAVCPGQAVAPDGSTALRGLLRSQ